jgi:pimeloyl-ACP methyl ester carboxylesterase
VSRELSRLLGRAPRRVLAAATTVAVCAGVLVATTAGTSASASPSTPAATSAARLAAKWSGTKPTIVLVHGAFADASGWSAEVRFLARAGFPVLAPADPLRGVASDAAYIDSVLKTITGPVILVGHSYGGAVIAAAARKAPNVKALVYVSAFIPEGRNPAAYYTGSAFPGSLLSNSTLLIRPTYNPTIAGSSEKANDQDVYIQPKDFRAIFAADQSRSKAAVMAAEQRPVSLAAYTAQTVPAAALPSWDLVSLNDKAIPPAAQLYMAGKAHAHVTKVPSAHDSLISHPGAVDYLILQAAASTT